MHRILAIMLVGTGMVTSPAASAQSWSGYYGNHAERGHYQSIDDDDEGYGDDGRLRAVCSGQRAHGLEATLRHEEQEDEIDREDARRIHSTIDRLEDRQRQECAEGDWRMVREISFRFDRVEQWINRWAHGTSQRGW